MIVLDENSVRLELLRTAAKTMFGEQPARRMISPPFQVESHLNQNIQAADWIATIVGRFWYYELDQGFAGYEYKRYFWTRFHSLATHSTAMKRSVRSASNVKERVGSLRETINAAQEKKDTGTIRISDERKVTVITETSFSNRHPYKARPYLQAAKFPLGGL